MSRRRKGRALAFERPPYPDNYVAAVLRAERDFLYQVGRETGIPDKIINVGCMMEYMDHAPRTLAEPLEAGAGGIGERDEKY